MNGNMNGNMDLVHQDNAGYNTVNTDPSRHGSRMFVDQQTVDRYVDKANCLSAWIVTWVLCARTMQVTIQILPRHGSRPFADQQTVDRHVD